MRIWKFGLAAALVATSVQAQEITREGADELMEWCQRDRAQKIAPLKAEAIEKCVAESGFDRESCERRNRHFGEVRQGADGTVPGLFWDSELCLEALDAKRYFRRNPRATTYTPGVTRG